MIFNNIDSSFQTIFKTTTIKKWATKKRNMLCREREREKKGPGKFYHKSSSYLIWETRVLHQMSQLIRAHKHTHAHKMLLNTTSIEEITHFCCYISIHRIFFSFFSFFFSFCNSLKVYLKRLVFVSPSAIECITSTATSAQPIDR